jgi:alkylation response protein AidB-like acyl-CoA dehydrogenase
VEIKLSAEQELFTEVAAELAAGLASRWQLGRGPDSVGSAEPPAKAWQSIADAGLLALRLGEALGGGEASCLDVCLLSEQLGRHAVPAPVLGTLLVTEQLRCREAEPWLLADIAAGRRRLSPVLTGDLRDFAASPAGARAWDCAGASAGVIVAGAAQLVTLGPAAAGADLTRAVAAVDGTPEAAIKLGAPATPGTADRVTAFALVVVAADLLGVMQGALDAAAGHARTRTQFGAPIGSFQAIQHLVAECLVSVEATRSAVWYAAWAADELPSGEALAAARTAKAFASVCGVEVTEAAVQIFGGMGMTWESRAHVWLRRAQVDRRLFGDENVQYKHLANAQLGPLPEPGSTEPARPQPASTEPARPEPAPTGRG